MKAFWIGQKCLGDSVGVCAAAHWLFKITNPRVPIQVSFWEPFRYIATWFDGIEWVPECPNEQIDVGGDPDVWSNYNGVTRFLRFMTNNKTHLNGAQLELNRKKMSPQHIAIVTRSNMNDKVRPTTLLSMIIEALQIYGNYPLIQIGHFDNPSITELGLTNSIMTNNLDQGIRVSKKLRVIDYRTDDRTGFVTLEHVRRSIVVIGPHTGIMFLALGLEIPCWCESSKAPHHNFMLEFPNIRPRWFERT